MTELIIYAVAALAAAWAVLTYNRLVRDRNRVGAAWSDIDVQLQRRHDLIPRLVEAVRAYAGYERATLETVTALRERSRAARQVAEIAELERGIDTGLRRLVALAEAYPDLKADTHFLELQQQLAEVEDHLQYARRFYNGAVRLFNTRIESFPDLAIARPFNFAPADFFDADPGADAPVRVELSGPGS